MMNRLRSILSHQSLPLVASILAIALTLPSLWTGWQLDDLVQRYTFLGYPFPAGRTPTPLDQFRFLDGDTTYARAIMDEGLMPWWTLPTLRLSFWRPVSSLTHWADYLLWPNSSFLMHVQNLFWLVALIIAAACLYRRLSEPAWIAGLAALFFALDDAHGLPAGWIANRNALIAGVFGILALIIHDRWRRQNWRPGMFLGPFFLLLALLAGETAAAVCAYLLAYALFLDSGPGRTRVVSLLPYAIIALGWFVAYTALGFGTWGSGFYVDPISEPLQFLAAVAWKGPLLLADQMFFPPSSFVLFFPKLVPAVLVWDVLLLILLGWLFSPLLRQDKRARFWATGMLLSIPLLCTTMPHSRLLVLAGVGGFGLLADWIAGLVEGATWLPRGKAWNRAARVMLIAFLFLHLVIAPVLLEMNATSSTFSQRYIQDAACAVQAGPELAQQDLVIVNHPVTFYGHYFSTARFLAGQSVPHHLRVLAPADGLLRVARTDRSTLVMKPQGGFFGLPFDNVFRNPSHPLRVGDCVNLTGMTVEINTLTEDGRPSEVSFRFSVPLEDSSLRWLRWEGEGYSPFTIPAIGESVVLPAAPPLF
jgi:hypothetical protein